MSERQPDTVEFTVSGVWQRVVVAADGHFKTEEVPGGDGLLQSVCVYAEGEFVAEYVRGDKINEADADLVRKAAESANIILAENNGDLFVPGEA